jgi:hypothetical protein
VPSRRDAALGLIFVIAKVAASSYILLEEDLEERTTVKIAALNIQIFGRAKRQKEDVWKCSSGSQGNST